MKNVSRNGLAAGERFGVIPAAGYATRIGSLPCSKEIYPIGCWKDSNGEIRHDTACRTLLESMCMADVDRVYVVVRKGKWDIPAYLGSGAGLGLHLAYLVTDRTPGAPFTVDQAFPFVKDATVLFGFPDIVFRPRDAFLQLLRRQQSSKGDIVLGLFTAHNSHKMDMVSVDDRGRVTELMIKPLSTALIHTWIIAVWTSVFTRFIHDYLSRCSMPSGGGKEELFLGDVIRAWMQEGFPVETVIFEGGKYFDIGTPDDLNRATIAKFED
jgi:glucose-1-phosphate thymidylyltransferase